MTESELLLLVSRLNYELAEVALDEPIYNRARLDLEWLETQLQRNTLELPANWDSALFPLVNERSFRHMPKAHALATELVAELRGLMGWNFTFTQLSECTNALRTIGGGATSMEEVANRMVDYLYNNLLHQATNDKVCALVRIFKTHKYAELDDAAKAAVVKALSFEPQPTMRCLTLLASRGIEPEWNSRFRSVSHQAIPLTSVDMVQQSPMISRLLDQLGVDIAPLIRSEESIIVDPSKKEYGVFYIPEAKGSEHIPGQDFVRKYGIHSVVGFGGQLPSREVFAVIIFANAFVSARAAGLFKSVALSAELGLLQHEKTVFAATEGEATGGASA